MTNLMFFEFGRTYSPAFAKTKVTLFCLFIYVMPARPADTGL